MGETLDRAGRFIKRRITSPFGRGINRVGLDRLNKDQETISALRAAGALNDHQEASIRGAVNKNRVSDPNIDVDALVKLGSKNIKNLQDTVKSTYGEASTDEDKAVLEIAYQLAQEAEAQARIDRDRRARRAVLLGISSVTGAGLLALLYANLPQSERVGASAPTLAPLPTSTEIQPVALPSPVVSPTMAPTVKIIPPGAPIAEKARLILEEDYLGPEAIEKAFGIRLNPDKIPQIPFSQADLEWAKGLGEMLVLRTSTYSDGRPFTALIMESILGDLFFKNNKSRVFAEHSVKDANLSIEGGNVYFNHSPRPGWAFVSKEPLSTTINKGYLDQTQALTEYISTKEFLGGKVPDKFKEAIDEVDKNMRPLYEKYNGNPVISTAASRRELFISIVGLKINQLSRPSFSEVCYDLLIYFQNNGIRLLPQLYTYTGTPTLPDSVANSYVMAVGRFGLKGIEFAGMTLSGGAFTRPEGMSAILSRIG